MPVKTFYTAWLAGLCAVCFVLALAFDADVRLAAEQTMYVGGTLVTLVVL